jgi:hypothetical protein
VVLWLGLTYAVFTGLVVEERKPTLAEGIHGGWLLAVVATRAFAYIALAAWYATFVGLLRALATGLARSSRAQG